MLLILTRGFLGGSDGKSSACKAGDLGSIPGSGISSEEGNGTPLQDSCLENPMDGSSADMDLGVLLKSPQGSKSSSRVGACTCAFLPSSSSSVTHPFVFSSGS